MQARRDQAHRLRIKTKSRLLTAIVAPMLMSASACSVTTPRNGAAVTAAGETGSRGQIAGQGASGPSADGAVSGPGSAGNGSFGGTNAVTSRAAASGGSSTGHGVGAAGGSGGPVTGVTDTNVKIAVIAPFGGVYGPAVQKVFEGMLTWRDDVNAHRGIHGRTIELIQIDNQNTAEGGIAACKQALSSGAFLVFVAASIYTTEMDCLNQAGQLTLYFSAPEQVSSGFTSLWGVFASAEASGRANARFVQTQLGGSSKKLGVIYTKGTVHEIAAQAYIAEARKLGMTVVDSEVIEQNQATYTSQVLRLQQSGADVVAIMALLETVGILRDAKAIGYAPQWTGEGVLDLISTAARDLAKGMKGVRYAGTVDSAAFANMYAKMQQYGRNTVGADGETLMMYGYGVVTGHVLDEAGPALTRKSFVSALARIQNFDPAGALAPVGWPNGQSQGSDKVFPVVCCDSGWHWKSLGPPASHF
jgi:branched-chain amino acid transport system substrate-binding protein